MFKFKKWWNKKREQQLTVKERSRNEAITEMIMDIRTFRFKSWKQCIKETDRNGLTWNLRPNRFQPNKAPGEAEECIVLFLARTVISNQLQCAPSLSNSWLFTSLCSAITLHLLTSCGSSSRWWYETQWRPGKGRRGPCRTPRLWSSPSGCLTDGAVRPCPRRPARWGATWNHTDVRHPSTWAALNY